MCIYKLCVLLWMSISSYDCGCRRDFHRHRDLVASLLNPHSYHGHGHIFCRNGEFQQYCQSNGVCAWYNYYSRILLLSSTGSYKVCVFVRVRLHLTNLFQLTRCSCMELQCNNWTPLHLTTQIMKLQSTFLCSHSLFYPQLANEMP